MYESIIKSNMLNIMWGGGQGVESQVSKKWVRAFIIQKNRFMPSIDLVTTFL